MYLNLFLNSDVEMYPRNGAIMVKVNGEEIPINNLPYLHPEGMLFKFRCKANLLIC